MPKGCHSKTTAALVELITDVASTEQQRINNAIDLSAIQSFTEKTMQELTQSLNNDTWKQLFPGRSILAKFCSSKYADMDFGRFKNAYIAATASAPVPPFEEIELIFASFSSYSATPPQPA